MSTNQPQYATGADKILVLSDFGQVTFFGTPDELKACTLPEVQLLLKVLEEKAQVCGYVGRERGGEDRGGIMED